MRTARALTLVAALAAFAPGVPAAADAMDAALRAKADAQLAAWGYEKGPDRSEMARAYSSSSKKCLPSTYNATARFRRIASVFSKRLMTDWWAG